MKTPVICNMSVKYEVNMIRRHVDVGATCKNTAAYRLKIMI